MSERPLTDPLSDSLVGLSEQQRAEAMSRFRLLQPHLVDDVTLADIARSTNTPLRTVQRWAAQYRSNGLVGLARPHRSDAGRRKMPSALVELVEGLALQKPRLSAAAIHRRVVPLAEARQWQAPSYAAVHAVCRNLDPALMALAHEGVATYRDRFELIHRHRAERPNALWQTDHTLLDILVLDANGETVRPWLTIVLDDYSRAITGYMLFVGAPSAIQTALALRQAIWRKATPTWSTCGLPDALYTDHGSDFTSRHIEQVAADLHIELIFSAVARPQGRGKIERFFGTINTELLLELPGALVSGKPATAPRLSLAELDAAIYTFAVETYNARVHSEIGQSPDDAWRGDGWLARMPQSLEDLDLLLVMVARSRLIRRDGIRFQGLRYTDPTLAAFVGQSITIRYDPRDITEIRVFHGDRFLCRAVSAENAHRTISLQDIQQARIARRKALRSEIASRTRAVTEFLPEPPPPTTPVEQSQQKNASVPAPKLFLYEEDKKS